MKAILMLEFEADIDLEDKEYYTQCAYDYDQQALFKKFDVDFGVPTKIKLKFIKEKMSDLS